MISVASLDNQPRNFDLVLRTAQIIPRKLDSVRFQLE